MFIVLQISFARGCSAEAKHRSQAPPHGAQHQSAATRCGAPEPFYLYLE